MASFTFINPEPEVEVISLNLTRKEAEALRYVLGHCIHSTSVAPTSAIWRALQKAGISDVKLPYEGDIFYRSI